MLAESNAPTFGHDEKAIQQKDGLKTCRYRERGESYHK